jgi:DNA-binding XRE family transcriptional regulator
MPKSLNPNLVKIHRNYTVEEAAKLLGVHKNTIRTWIKDGLSICDERRPTLILGFVLRTYLQTKRESRKRKCHIDEMYCMRCRAPKRPAGSIVDLIPKSASVNRLTGLCPTCGSLMNRFASDSNLERIMEKLDVGIPRSLKHLINCNSMPVNSDFS